MSDPKYVYRLINPYVEGSMDKIFKASDSFKAGKKAYREISKYFTNSVQTMNMVLQNVQSKELSHFHITEKRGNDDSIDYGIVQLRDSVPADIEKQLINNVSKLEKQSGGKRHHHRDEDDDSSSSSDSDNSESEYYRRRSEIYPVSKFVYFHLPYVKYTGLSPNDYRLFMPVFSWPISPTVEIRLDLYKY